jgi:NADPH:quinone reductase-like Zn-dependent oxidoreductase
MSVSRALFLKEKFGAFEARTKTLPDPGPGEVLIKVIAAGLNPVDWKIQSYGIFVVDFPTPLGSDASGKVEAVGKA